MADNYISGIGNLSQNAFSIYSDGINYEKMPGTNNHNESFVEVQLNRDDWFNDNTDAFFSCDGQQCYLKIAMNSEVETNLYNNGFFNLIYDRAQQKWSMQARQMRPFEDEDKAREWAFCSPDVSVSQVVSILRYLAQDDEKSCGSDCTEIKLKGLNGDLRAIATSIGKSYAMIVQSANVFAGEACFAEPPSSLDPYIDSPVPAYGGS